MDSSRSQMLALASDVADALCMTVADEPDRVRGARITDAKGRGYNLSEDRIGDAKLTIRPVYPDCSFYVYDAAGDKIEPGQIGVSKSRGGKAIAADIVRRLEPHYFYRLRKIIDINERIAESEASRLKEVDTVRAALGSVKVAMPGHLQSEGRSQLIVGPAGSGGDLMLGGPGGSVTFERFSVPTGVALQMLAAYREYEEGK